MQMPQQKKRGHHLSYRGQSEQVAHEHRQSKPCSITLHDVFSDLLLHSTAQVLLRLTCVLDGRDAFLLVEVTAPHELRVGQRDNMHLGIVAYQEDLACTPVRVFPAQTSMRHVGLAAVSQARNVLRSGVGVISRASEGSLKLKVD